MPSAIIDGIVTRYEVVGSGPPLLMYAPGGFNAVVEAWSTLGVYQKIKLLDHLPAHFTCILFDRRECGQSGGRVEPITWLHYVAQGKGLLDHLHISRAHLMGGCMGCHGNAQVTKGSDFSFILAEGSTRAPETPSALDGLGSAEVTARYRNLFR